MLVTSDQHVHGNAGWIRVVSDDKLRFLWTPDLRREDELAAVYN